MTMSLLRAVRAEWTKLRSVRSTASALLAMVALVVLIGVLTAQGGHSSYGGPSTFDEFAFVHRTLGDQAGGRTAGAAAARMSVTARVAAQSDSAPWAKAGVVLKDGTDGGSASVALMVTPDHGVRLQGGPAHEVAVHTDGTPVWLRLTRTGHRVTGEQSADGRVWHTVGTVGDQGLPATVQAGLFVASPAVSAPHWDGPGRVVGRARPTVGRAVFDDVAVTGAVPAGARGGGAGPDGDWQLTDVVQPDSPGQPGQPSTGPHGTLHRAGGSFTVTGSGDLGSPGVGGIGQDQQDDTVADTLSGVQIGLFAVIALGVLAVTSEYRTRTIRTTFTVSPRRSVVLVAKAAVLAGSVFVAGLVACAVSFVVASPIQRRNGFGPPIFPRYALTDPPVLRAVAGTAAFLALIALLSMGVGVLVRRTAAAVITLFTVLVVLPVVASITSVGANLWVGRATPIAGAAIRETHPLFEDAIGPWAGFTVLLGWTAVVLGAAFWVQRGRDA